MTIIATTMILIMFVMLLVLVVLFIGSPLVSLVPDLLTHGLWCRNPNIPNITTQRHQKNMKIFNIFPEVRCKTRCNACEVIGSRSHPATICNTYQDCQRSRSPASTTPMQIIYLFLRSTYKGKGIH